MSVLYVIRHGQASFGTADYDRLSPRGIDQSRALGADLMLRGVRPERIVSGGMNRQRQTADGIVGAAGWDAAHDIDPRWDEYSATDLLAACPDHNPAASSNPRTFQRQLEKATARWASGDHDADYSETFLAFTRRVEDALNGVIAGLGSGQTAVVVSSSGPIAWAAALLLSGMFPQWSALSRVTVNSGVTKIVIGSSGRTLLSFNDHGHLPRSWVTYR